MNHIMANKDIYLPSITLNQPISTLLGCSLPQIRSNPFSDQIIPPFLLNNSLDFQNFRLQKGFVKIPSFPQQNREDTQSPASSTEWFDLEERHSLEQLQTSQLMEKSTLNKLLSLHNQEEFYTRDPINFENLKLLTQARNEDLRRPLGLSNASKKIIKHHIDLPQNQTSHKEEFDVPSKAKRSIEGLKKLKHSKLRSKRNPWRPSEDAKLLELVQVYGEAWAMISAKLVNRTGKQIRDRYLNILRPNLKKGDWSPQEDNLLVTLSHEIGHKWSSIAKHMPGRSEAQVKNRFYSHIKKRIEGKGEDLGMLGSNLSCSGSGLAETETEGSERWMEEEREEAKVKLEENEKLRMESSGIKIEAEENLRLDNGRKLPVHFKRVREEKIPDISGGMNKMQAQQREANVNQKEDVVSVNKKGGRSQPINEKEVDLVIEILARYYEDNDKGKKSQNKDRDDTEDNIVNKVNRLHQLDLRKAHLELLLMKTQQEMDKIQSR